MKKICLNYTASVEVVFISLPVIQAMGSFVV